MRRALVTVVLTTMFAFGVGGSGATAASASSLPAEGVFESCPVESTMAVCAQRLVVMHQGGVNVVVLPIGSGAPSVYGFYAAVAHELGMSVMWATSKSNPTWWQDPASSTIAAGSYSGFASACGCQQNGPLLDYLIHYLGSLPGTYGYYAADDSILSPGDGPGVTNYVAQIKRDDSQHTVMIGSADQSQTTTYQRSADLIGTELYPVTNSSLLPVSQNQSMWGGIDQMGIDAQTSANRDGKQSAFILQAFTWGDNLADGQAIGVCSPSDTQASCYAQLHYPSPSEQLTLRNQILAHSHPKLILWWSFPGTYGQAGSDTYTVYPTGAVAAARWRGLSDAIQAPWPSASAHPTAVKATAASLRPHQKKKKKKKATHKRSQRHRSRKHKTRATHALAHWPRRFSHPF